MATIIDHPSHFKDGVRLIMRVWRNKEGVEGRRPGRTLISRDAEQWNQHVAELVAECIPGERVYASADPRDTDKAIRLFKQRQLNADYDNPRDRFAFYDSCFNRWLSCLGSPHASQSNTFLFDCDTAADAASVRCDLDLAGVRGLMIRSYSTKNGTHIVTLPFNPAKLGAPSRALLQKNPLILVAYT